MNTDQEKMVQLIELDKDWRAVATRFSFSLIGFSLLTIMIVIACIQKDAFSGSNPEDLWIEILCGVGIVIACIQIPYLIRGAVQLILLTKDGHEIIRKDPANG